MGRKTKYTQEQKLWAVEMYKSGQMSAVQIAQSLSMPKKGPCTVREWFHQYEVQGTDAFSVAHKNKFYSREFKEQVCKDYLAGKGSYKALAAQYGIPSDVTVRNWMKQYTGSQNELRDYDPKPEVYMAARRKTTQEERKKIVQWYLDKGQSYKETAAKFDCSYTQVRNWVIKFNQSGEEGLKDGRGRKKQEDELTELEKFKNECERLKAINRRQEMEIELLKKAEEAERRRWFKD